MSYTVSNSTEFTITPMKDEALTLTQGTAAADALIYYGKKEDYI